EPVFARSQDDGGFVLASVPAGQWTLVAEGADGSHGELAVSIPAQGLSDIVVDLRPRASVRGVVTDQAGVAVSNTTVALVEDRPGADPRSGVTDGEGGFELLGVPAGNYGITVTGREGMTLVVRGADGAGGPTLKIGSDPVDDLQVSVHVPDGVVSGVVLGPQGEPRSDAWVALRRSPGESGPGRPLLLTGPDGVFSFEHVGAGDHILYVWSADGDAGAQREAVVAGAQVELELRQRGGVRGHITANGTAVTTFHIASARLFDRTFISEDGSFELDRLRTGESTLEITAPEGSLTTSIDVASSAPTELSFELEPWARTTGRTVSIEGEPVAGLSVTVQTFMGNNFLRLGGGGFRGTGEGVVTDAAGRFSVGRIPVGEVTLAFHRGATPSTPGSIGVGGVHLALGSGITHDLGDIVVLTSPAVADDSQGTLGLRAVPSFGPPGEARPPTGSHTAAGLWVARVEPDGPAAVAGVLAGDRIVAIDGRSVAELGAQTAAALLGRQRVERERPYEVTVSDGEGERAIEIIAGDRQ
ncbi:MAG: carboxypeptidase regulatory-like domain-containing protein, partial [Nannocystaceae bacterium]|nr:carboxypeptidase regulatory-like domain-containing protein [Nannocystaceae bacterium]